MANYTRYSPSDWASSNMSHFNSADNARNNSERIRCVYWILFSYLALKADLLTLINAGVRPFD